MSLIFAHRGSSGIYPENTMLAFEKAIEQNCDGIELDIHLTKDDKLVVCHDFTLERTTNGKGYIKDFTLDELQTFNAGSWKDQNFNNCHLPSLEEVFQLIRDTDILLNIELKAGSRFYPNIEKILLNLIDNYKLKDQCLISSFDHQSLLTVRSLDNNIYTGILYSCAMVEPWLYCEKLKANALHPYYLTIDDELIKKCYEYGIDINTYTVNTLEETLKLFKTGITAIITNYPKLKEELIKG